MAAAAQGRERVRARRAIAAFVALLLLFGLAACTDTEVPDAATPEPPADESAPSTETVSYAPYVGYWCDSDNAKRSTMSTEGMDQIEILSASADTVTFTLLHTGAGPSYRMTGSESPITAGIADGVASFEFRDERGSLNTGIIRFLEYELVVEILMTEVDSTASGSAAMHCLMLRDEHYGDRIVQEDVYEPRFAGVVGAYERSSDSSDIPSIQVVSVESGRVQLDITGTHDDTVYYEQLSGRIVDETTVEVQVPKTGVTLLLRWENPGTINVECLQGTPSGAIGQLLESPTYWNSAYLHTS